MRSRLRGLAWIAALYVLASCNPWSGIGSGRLNTKAIYLTAASSEGQTRQDNVAFQAVEDAPVVVTVFPDSVRQTMEGIGSSFTEASAFVLAHLDPMKRHEIMKNIYGAEGANFSLARTHIGACDFTVAGRYSYAEEAGDTSLGSFTLARDMEGFDPARYPGIRDSTFDLLPMIQEALAIKEKQADSRLSIVASAWTAPAWMKDNEDYYTPGSAENNWQGTGGTLKPEYVPTYAEYLLKYLAAYDSAGVSIWGLTPVNEPHGVGGAWESMAFSAETESAFIQTVLGPRLRNSAYRNVRLLAYDQNRDGLEHWANTIFAADQGQGYVHGMAMHWYASTFRVFEEVLDQVHARFPEYTLMHTEGCIDNLGNDPPEGVSDPEGYKESNWFGNDAFWWSKTATDWGYAVPWEGVNVADHPMYVPVHRYARNIIESIDHWTTGWIDWNIVLDRDGGPNHVGNYCGAPIMIDTASGEVYYTPIFQILSQFSRSIRPGDLAVKTTQEDDGLGEDDLHTCATLSPDGMLSVQLLNTSVHQIVYSLRIGDQQASIQLPANSVQTVQVQL